MGGVDREGGAQKKEPLPGGGAHKQPCSRAVWAHALRPLLTRGSCIPSHRRGVGGRVDSFLQLAGCSHPEYFGWLGVATQNPFFPQPQDPRHRHREGISQSGPASSKQTEQCHLGLITRVLAMYAHIILTSPGCGLWTLRQPRHTRGAALRRGLAGPTQPPPPTSWGVTEKKRAARELRVCSHEPLAGSFGAGYLRPSGGPWQRHQGGGHGQSVRMRGRAESSRQALRR